MEKTKYIIMAIIGCIGSFVTNFLGGWSTDTTTLIVLMGVDFIMGLMLALVFKNSNKTQSGAAESNTLFKGLCKKLVALLFVLVGYRIDLTFGMNYVRTAVIIAFITNELLSIVENAGLMGLPIPKVIVGAIDILQKKTEKE